MQDSKRDTDVKKRLLDSVGEGEGGMNWKFWSMTETQEAPQLTSTPGHTKLTATTQSH